MSFLEDVIKDLKNRARAGKREEERRKGRGLGWEVKHFFLKGGRKRGLSAGRKV